MKVPLLDLKPQYQMLKNEIEPAVLELMANQTFVLGPTVQTFEMDIASYCHVNHAVGVSSGTDALICSLMALGIGPGDEVILPTFTFFATAGAVARIGAIPVFVDIDPETYNIDVNKMEEAITDQTRAIIPVHLYGQMAPMAEIMAVATKHELVVIEDACQSIGASQNGQFPGELGTTACLSFYPSKNLAGFGDGGMILCQEESVDRRCRHMRMHGEDQRYYHSMVGGNFRLDSLQALVLNIKLKHLDGWAAKRQEHAAIYDELLGSTVKTPVISEGNISVYNQYVIRSDRRDALQKYLGEKEIGAAIYYPVPLHLQKCFAYLDGQEGDCPVAEQACKEVLALPVFPDLTHEQIEYVASCIKDF